jgi:NitT/TauT family transport system substrate-binding protein
MAGQPKAPFYVVLALIVAGLVGVAVYRGALRPPPDKQTQQATPIKPGDLAIPPEAPVGGSVTTVKEVEWVPAQRLPPVEGVSGYDKMTDNTVKFALNVWAGWAPIILANEGMEPKKVWKTPDGQEFKVKLELIDDPIAMRKAYVAGRIHIGWATLDMVPLFVDGFVQDGDSRIMPRIFQQIDWSNGGDGIVVRQGIKTVGDLRGKKLVLAQNSPSQYFALNMLVFGGVQPSEVNMIYTKTAFQAARAFETQKDIAGAVSWSPDIYKLAESPGNRMLVSTQTANKLIADVWFARADFAKDNPGIIEGLVRGIFDAMTELKKPEKKQECAKLMAGPYAMSEQDALKMFDDAHSTNWAENYQFFMNENNPTNFQRIWDQSYRLYRRIGTIENQPVAADQVMDFSVIKKLQAEEKYASQKDESKHDFAAEVGQPTGPEVLTFTVVINFFPNSADLHKKVPKVVDGRQVEEPYDPAVDAKLEEIAKHAGQLSAARMRIEGHTDSSMRGQVPEELVKELSMNRANSVKEAIVKKYKFDPDKFQVDGLGWSKPADPRDPWNHPKNRRVEVHVFQAEAQ